MNVVYYDKNKNCFKEKNIKSWAVSNKLDYIIELHKNGNKNTSANGTGVLIKQGTNSTNMAIANELLQVLCKYFKNWSTGIVCRTDLYNMNSINGTCNYSMLEICFNSNDDDNKIFDKNIKNIGNDLYIALSKLGIKNLGVIYGHGMGDVVNRYNA